MAEISYPHQRALDSQQAARTFAGQALNSLFLVNGGALVALLALAGAYAQGGTRVPDGLTSSGYPFATGLALSVGAAIAAYATQFALSSYREDQASNRQDERWKYISLLFGVIAMGLMIGSLWFAIDGFGNVGAAFGNIPKISD